jgi:hypothetical protein
MGDHHPDRGGHDAAIPEVTMSGTRIYDAGVRQKPSLLAEPLGYDLALAGIVPRHVSVLRAAVELPGAVLALDGRRTLRREVL